MRFILPLIALVTAAAPAIAAEEVVTVRIAYGDVNVTTPEGRAAIEARIDTHLRKACAIQGAARYNQGRTAVDSKCVIEARSVALAEFERVAALEARSSGTVAAN